MVIAYLILSLSAVKENHTTEDPQLGPVPNNVRQAVMKPVRIHVPVCIEWRRRPAFCAFSSRCVLGQTCKFLSAPVRPLRVFVNTVV